MGTYGKARWRRTVVFKALRDIAANEELTWFKPDVLVAKCPAPMPVVTSRRKQVGGEGRGGPLPRVMRTGAAKRREAGGTAVQRYRSQMFDCESLKAVLIIVPDSSLGFIDSKEMCICGSTVSARQHQIFCRRCGNCFHSFCVQGRSKNGKVAGAAGADLSGRSTLDPRNCPVCGPTVAPPVERAGLDGTDQDGLFSEEGDLELRHGSGWLPSYLDVQRSFREHCRCAVKRLVEICDGAERSTCSSVARIGGADQVEMSGSGLDPGRCDGSRPRPSSLLGAALSRLTRRLDLNKYQDDLSFLGDIISLLDDVDCTRSVEEAVVGQLRTETMELVKDTYQLLREELPEPQIVAADRWWVGEEGMRDCALEHDHQPAEAEHTRGDTFTGNSNRRLRRRADAHRTSNKRIRLVECRNELTANSGTEITPEVRRCPAKCEDPPPPVAERTIGQVHTSPEGGDQSTQSCGSQAGCKVGPGAYSSAKSDGTASDAYRQVMGLHACGEACRRGLAAQTA